MLIKYDKDTFKILGYYTGNINDIKLKDNEAIKELEVQDCGQTDIRAYNEDGSVKSLGEQIKEKILILNDNEVIKNGVVVQLNPAYEDDYIELVKRGVEKLDDNKKIEYDNENKNYYITEKTLEEKLIDNLITPEEFIEKTNEEIIHYRVYEYSKNLDGRRAELLDMVLNRLSISGNLIEQEEELLNEINIMRESIKVKYKKL